MASIRRITYDTGKQAAHAPRVPHLVGRDFSAKGSNKAWFADITYVRTRRGWLYMTAVMDVWSRKVVGWSMGPRMTAELADDALRMAISTWRPDPGCIHHSDHGSQYASLLVGRIMREAGIRPSMGAISSPWDNAVTESLMGCIKSECVHARTFDSREQAALEIFDALRRLKGIDTVTAASIACEAAGFLRFDRAPSFAARIGLVPSEHSSDKS